VRLTANVNRTFEFGAGVTPSKKDSVSTDVATAVKIFLPTTRHISLHTPREINALATVQVTVDQSDKAKVKISTR